jgi:hypothetical protein
MMGTVYLGQLGNKKYVVKEQRVSIGLPTMNIDVVP